MLILCQIDASFPLLYHSTVHAKATVELGERIQQMTLPDPSLLKSTGNNSFLDFVFHYPHFIEFIKKSVRFFLYENMSSLAHRAFRHLSTELRSTIATFTSMSNISKECYWSVSGIAQAFPPYSPFSIWTRICIASLTGMKAIPTTLSR